MAAAIVKMASIVNETMRVTTGIWLKFAILYAAETGTTVATYFKSPESKERMSPSRTYLTDDDIRFEFRFMMRWCRLFRKSAADWVNLEAKRFRERYPLLTREPDCQA